MKEKLKLLKEITDLAGVPAREKNVSKYIHNEIKPYTDEIKYDNLGSLIGVKGSGRHVMIAGHMDEIGLIVTKITKEGFIKFQTLGGWFSQVMLAQVWEIHTHKGILYGVTGVKPPHIIPPDQRKNAIGIEEMYLDIGVKDYDEAFNLGVRPGDMIVPHTEFKTLGNEKYLLAKAWDNRVGSAVVIEVLKNLGKINSKLFATFTTQEEVGLRGAKTSSYIVKPEIAIALDVGVANDVPGGDKDQQELGKGPQILIYDAGLIPHQGLRNYVIELAKKENIPYQEAYIKGGRTDAGNMHLAHSGAAGLSICVPTRYMHSHTSMIHYDDYINTIKLVTKLIESLDDKKIEEILKH